MGRWMILGFGFLLVAMVGAPGTTWAAAWDANCQVENAAGPSANVAPVPAPAGRPESVEERAAHRRHKEARAKPVKLSLTADPSSANRVVNLGADREPEEVTLRVNAAPRVPPGYGRRLEVVAEPFVSSSETADTNGFSEPTFSHLHVSGNRKRITFKMCIDAPNDLPAGKYLSTVLVEGPPPVEAALISLTVNGKDGGHFWEAAGITALLAFLVLLYKGAAEKRALLIAKAQTKPEGNERNEAIKAAERWRDSVGSCLWDLGWWVPTVAAVASAFGLLYAAYDANPAWGEGGLVTNAIALAGTGLAAIGAKAVFTPTASTH